MKIISLPTADNSVFSRDLAAFLKKGKVVMLPTDTVYGFSCRADNAAAIAKIFSLKSREAKKPLLVLVSSLSMVKKFCFINKIQYEKLKKIWSQARPTSVLLPHRGLLPKNLTAGSPYLAVRLPKSVFLRKIVRASASPLVSTSANLSGQKILAPEEAAKIFSGRKDLDLIVTGGSNKRAVSRLLLLEKNGNLKILRK